MVCYSYIALFAESLQMYCDRHVVSFYNSDYLLITDVLLFTVLQIVHFTKMYVEHLRFKLKPTLTDLNCKGDE